MMTNMNSPLESIVGGVLSSEDGKRRRAVQDAPVIDDVVVKQVAAFGVRGSDVLDKLA